MNSRIFHSLFSFCFTSTATTTRNTTFSRAYTSPRLNMIGATCLQFFFLRLHSSCECKNNVFSVWIRITQNSNAQQKWNGKCFAQSHAHIHTYSYDLPNTVDATSCMAKKSIEYIVCIDSSAVRLRSLFSFLLIAISLMSHSFNLKQTYLSF